MAHKKAGGSSRNGRDTEGRRLGVKKAGGQAVVGNVQSSPQSQPSRNQEPPALTDQSGMGMEIDAKLVPVKEPAKRRG